MSYTETELLSELEHCYDEQGTISAEILNDPTNDYPTQPTYQNYFGSLTEAKKRIGIVSGIKREEVIKSIEYCYDEFGDVKLSILFDNTEVHQQNFYAHFDTLEEAIRQSSVRYKEYKENREANRKMYDKEELLESLEKCKEIEGDTKSSTVNESDTCPSTEAYKARFGSIVNARKLAGIECSWKNTINDEIENALEQLPEYDPSDDAHVYTLEISINGEKYYYVGESTRVIERLSSHKYVWSIGTTKIGKFGKEYVPRDESGKVNDVQLERIHSLIPMNQQDGEDDKTFRRRRKEKEREQSYSIAIENGTTKVLGGR